MKSAKSLVFSSILLGLISCEKESLKVPESSSTSDLLILDQIKTEPIHKDYKNSDILLNANSEYFYSVKASDQGTDFDTKTVAASCIITQDGKAINHLKEFNHNTGVGVDLEEEINILTLEDHELLSNLSKSVENDLKTFTSIAKLRQTGGCVLMEEISPDFKAATSWFSSLSLDQKFEMTNAYREILVNTGHENIFHIIGSNEVIYKHKENYRIGEDVYFYGFQGEISKKLKALLYKYCPVYLKGDWEKYLAQFRPC